MPTDPPVLVGCAHGTRDPAGRRAIARLRLDSAALRPGLRLVAAHVDVHKPALDDVVVSTHVEPREDARSYDDYAYDGMTPHD